MSGQSKRWAAPSSLVIQPGSLLVPGRPGYVPEGPLGGPAGDDGMTRFVVEGGRLSRRFVFVGRPSGALYSGPDLTEVGVSRWDLSSLTGRELDSLQVALDAQRLAGIGRRCPVTRAERLALGGSL